MREGLDVGQRKSGEGLEDRTQAAQQDVRTIAIGWQSQFAAEFS